MRRLFLGLLLAAVAVAAPREPTARGRLGEWLKAAGGAPAAPLLPGLRSRDFDLPGMRARLPDWPVVGADLRGARGHVELAERRLGRRLELRWVAARPGQLEELVRAWGAEAGGPGRTLSRPTPTRIGGIPGVEVIGRAVVREGGALWPRRDRSRREHHWFWYDPSAARVQALHLELPGGDVVLGERLGAALLRGLKDAGTSAPPDLAPGMTTWTGRGLGLQLDLPAWKPAPRSLTGRRELAAEWLLSRSGNAGRWLLVVGRGDGVASVRVEWRPMPREKTAEQTPVPSPADPAGSAHDTWTVCGHPARRTRFDQALGKSIRWSQEVAWYCPESLAEYRLKTSANEDFAPGLTLMNEVPERVRCHLPAARAWDPKAGPRLARVGGTP